MQDNIIKVDYKDEMEQSYIDYAMSVIVQRAIPDLRDGLKPVHRRILYAMRDLNLVPEKPYKKSARIIGDVLGKYHPHGDSSVYEAMVRLAQDFNTNYPLVEGQGNFGSIDGDSAAAMRYTEARLQPLSMKLLTGLDKNIIDYKDNFDNSNKEPEVLPAKFFNLLVNGSTGIAVGMSTNIPPHNLNEVNKACQAYLKDENITTSGLLKYIKGPDFPTGGEIINKKDLKTIYEKGSGRIRLRAKFKTEDLKSGRRNLIIEDIPYTFSGNKTRLLEDLISLFNDRKLDEVSDIRDESSSQGTRIVLEVKRGVSIENLKSKLFQISRLEDTVTVNMLSIVDNRPMVLSLKEMIGKYMEFLKGLYIKEYEFDLKKLIHDREIKEGLVKAYDIIDLIIEIIRGSKNKQDVMACLVSGNVENISFKNKSSKNSAKKLKFSEKQAESILKMQLQRLVGLELEKIKSELNEINNAIKTIEQILSEESILKSIISEDLEQISKDFKRSRRTKIKQIDEDDVYVQKEVVEDVYALIDRFNYIKIIDSMSYSRTSEDTLKTYKHIIKLRSNENLWIFAQDTNFYQIKLEDLPISKVSDRGTPLDNSLIPLLVASEKQLKGKELVFATKHGYIKKVDSDEFKTIRRQIIATKVRDDDELIFVDYIDDEEEVVMTTKNKRKIRFLLDEVSNQKRLTLGVKGINLNQNDYVVKVLLENESNKKKRNRGSKGEII